MTFTCNSCNTEKDFIADYALLVIEKWGEGIKRYCKACRTPRAGLIDVYFKGEYVDEHLSSEAHPGPKRIASRADKKMWLEKCNLRESGDRVHGANSFDPISHRHAEASLRR